METMENNFGYSDTVIDHFTSPRNVLSTSEDEYGPDGVGMVGNPTCGDMMKVWIKVDSEKDRITDLKWKTFGCASAIGSTSMMSIMITENGGMKLRDALSLTPQQIMDRLGGLPDIKIHCSVLGDKALRSAIHNYFESTGQKNRILEETVQTVCECANVTDKEIEEHVLEGADSFEKLQERTKISTGCGKCRPAAEKLFDEYRTKYFG
ncbi:MAG: iron-sulfur cluster assembly scaffold protein [bacterium]|nr:MAG: iron-sulfur cluster assembly scaffold protein [bacterium]